jgi:Fur family transcriptional regulator, peroxide stress response regulator
MINIREALPQYGLKITPQRVVVYEAVQLLKNHPTADNIIEFIRTNHPNIAVGTVYNTLETFVEKGLVSKVKTDGDIMRYDAATSRHHHLYSKGSNRIGDYYDDDLVQLIENYFAEKEIPGFKVEDVKISIIGEFLDDK